MRVLAFSAGCTVLVDNTSETMTDMIIGTLLGLSKFDWNYKKSRKEAWSR